MMLLLFLTTIATASCQTDIPTLVEKVNDVTTSFNAIAAEIAWQSSIDPGNIELPSRAANYQKERIFWEENACSRLAALESRHLLNSTERRMTYLMCREPRLTFEEARRTSALYQELQSIYEYAEICIPYEKTTQYDMTDVEDAILEYISTVNRVLKTKTNETILTAAKLASKETAMEPSICLKGESAFEEMMKFSRNEKVLRWLWLTWRDKVGKPMRGPYRRLVKVENKAARRNGYKDVGAAWRDELEIPDLRVLCRKLYYDIKPLYSLLHGVVRFFLRKAYGDIVPELGPIPAHLLGNLWAQNWDSIADLILPQTVDLDKSLKSSNWTALKLVKHAEDFYQSLGLPAMTAAFWRESVFERETPDTRCHGTAADMFKDGDFRLLYCSGVSAEDLYVLHHEMGHIQYYMAYEKQPGIFRQANSALHETIGDTIMYGVMTPQHLHRLGLINDSVLFTYPTVEEIEELLDEGKDEVNNEKKDVQSIDNTNYMSNAKSFKEDTSKTRDDKPTLNKLVTSDDILLLKQALNKIPQIPFALIIDEYRWKYFEGGLGKRLNEEFWDLTIQLQGIAPPESRDEDNFDAGAKYHVPDNTPFIRYFLSSFLQHQLFENLCKASVFGRLGVQEELPETITMNRCDIYGSRSAGKLLKDFMSRGHSQHWRQILKETIDVDTISASALKRYYRPLYKLLSHLVRAHRIPIGW
ncbi:hypothetical protein MSG28_015042 [Choristoneura fumiferana]|uniref:Uncharacterized protein n=1 Tax=Choristoneura fumiferana TaxID=7141 RepID=A0ACC0KY69_CHOFU|nr:hypothetical protein MSG28_015042 [Choristoneura fumiferana]